MYFNNTNGIQDDFSANYYTIQNLSHRPTVIFVMSWLVAKTAK